MSPVELRLHQVVKSYGYESLEDYYTYIGVFDFPEEMRRKRWECMKKLLNIAVEVHNESLGKTSSIQ